MQPPSLVKVLRSQLVVILLPSKARPKCSNTILTENRGKMAPCLMFSNLLFIRMSEGLDCNQTLTLKNNHLTPNMSKCYQEALHLRSDISLIAQNVIFVLPYLFQ